MKAICNLNVHVDPKALKPSSQTEEVPQGKKPGAKSRLRRKQSSKHTSESKTKASKSKTVQSEKETQSSSAKDKRPSHPLPPTLVVGEMHKEAHQAAGGPMERISKKRMKNEAKMTKPNTEWKNRKKTKSSQTKSLKKSTESQPRQSQSQEEVKVRRNIT
ncbi:hypothetical protein Tco_0764484 [Tanacetum coccineum]